MIRQEERQRRMAHIEAACQAGARRAPACVLAGIDARTYQRWQADADRRGDGRPLAERPKPAHALSETERAEILAVANEPRFAELPPARIVPALADEGSYIASESSFYRVLRAHHQIRHRGRAHAPTAAPKPPTTHHATRPRQVTVAATSPIDTARSTDGSARATSVNQPSAATVASHGPSTDHRLDIDIAGRREPPRQGGHLGTHGRARRGRRGPPDPTMRLVDGLANSLAPSLEGVELGQLR